MSITVLEAVSALNTALAVKDALEPLVAQARAAGLGDDHVFTEDELNAHDAKTVENIKSLRAQAGGA